MDYSVFFCLVLIVALFACMTADFILDMETIWNNAGHQLIGTQQQTLKVADISWVQVTLDSQESEPEINVIELAKEQMTPKLPNPGDKLWETLDAQFEQSKCKDLDYNSLTVKELKIIAKERAIPKYGSMRKSELIAALQL
jgi:type II secretory pathway component PulK